MADSAAAGHSSVPWSRRFTVRHGAFVVAAVAGGVAGTIGFLVFPKMALTIGADAWLAAYMAAALLELPRLTPEVLRRHADEDAPPVAVIMLVTLAVMGVAIFSLFMALNSGERPGAIEVALGVLAVILGWFVMNTMAGLHYAYEYYESPKEPGGGIDAGDGRVAGGFDWPGDEQPDGSSFLYLAYQVGAAYQLGDVAATSNRMRRLLVIHSTFTYFYGTLMLAATVNVIMSAAGAGG